MKKIKIGQIWHDYDIRFRKIQKTRRLEVIGFPNDLYVEVQNVDTKRKTIIAKHRMKPNSTGYIFVSDHLKGFDNSENLIGGW